MAGGDREMLEAAPSEEAPRQGSVPGQEGPRAGAPANPGPAPAGMETAGAPAVRAPGSGAAGGFFRTRLGKEAHDRLALFAVRALFFFVAAGLGLYAVRVLGELTLRQDLDPIVGVIAACITATVLILLESTFSYGRIRTISAITFGLIIGLILSLVFQPVVEFIVTAVASHEIRASVKFDAFLSFLRILTTAIFSYFGVTILLQTKDDFKFIIPYVEFRKEVKGNRPLIFDTSTFIDGRIESIIAASLFDQRLLVPKFVLGELQKVADSADRSLRERGRRGLDILNRIGRAYHVETVDHPLRPHEEVDDALLGLAAEFGGKLVTTDYNLQKNARLQGIAVLNVNDLATALKPEFVPGETMNVRLLREGDDKGQAVGFLKDGTMVVVENARQRIGQEVAIEVTSSIQTSAGKMLFGKLRRNARGADEA
jgi:uncharacterized protein YacL